MSAQAALHAALMAALQDGLGAQVNGVFAGPAVKATPPFIELGEMLVSDWGTKDCAGREIRTAVVVRDAGDGPGRIHELCGLAEAAVSGIASELDGWRIVSVALMRSRVVRSGVGAWAAMIEHRVRMLAE